MSPPQLTLSSLPLGKATIIVTWDTAMVLKLQAPQITNFMSQYPCLISETSSEMPHIKDRMAQDESSITASSTSR
ncbi:hypothetical protein sscle_07g057690 [Sclerotinia sclerotiorum 1980 UF-70]|uniref:Uncharacterized protein n=1 Tax=Sclerotinia sclerotiorum (strain ATCC 18683 / 1980 / Ss-1) TaxID=665079 RepID=A0A1D9Q7Z4_SCLS1|nr:hypothetical protein sscle_07g057690 [Sclerotinia sclerotiorum 1980 UF-70]